MGSLRESRRKTYRYGLNCVGKGLYSDKAFTETYREFVPNGLTSAGGNDNNK